MRRPISLNENIPWAGLFGALLVLPVLIVIIIDGCIYVDYCAYPVKCVPGTTPGSFKPSVPPSATENPNRFISYYYAFIDAYPQIQYMRYIGHPRAKDWGLDGTIVLLFFAAAMAVILEVSFEQMEPPDQPESTGRHYPLLGRFFEDFSGESKVFAVNPDP